MRFSFFLLVLLLAGKTALAQTVPSSCTPSTQLLQSYKNDVADLALQRLYEIGSPDTALIEIPQRYQDTIWQALAAVMNTGTALGADSISRNYCVHRWPHTSYRGDFLEIHVDTNYDWAKQWYLGNTQRIIYPIDSFLARHGVIVESYSRLRITRAINSDAFIDSLIKFAGVYPPYPYYFSGVGDQMYYSFDTASHFTFVAAWGDCMAGCMNWKKWVYTVAQATCAVKLDSISLNWNTPHYYPDYYNCNGNPLSVMPFLLANTASLTLFPNPATTTLQMQGLAGGPLTYRISDIASRALLEGITAIHQIDIAPLPAGFYLLTVREANGGIHTRRFVKE